MSDNVLLHLGEEPRFDQIKTEDIKPALQTAIAEAREQIAAIKAQTHTDWANTVETLTDITERVGRIWSVVSHLNSVVDTPELRAVYNELMPELTIFFTEIGQDIELYNRFKIIKNSAEFDTLSPAQQTKLNHDLRDFVLSGAELPPEQVLNFLHDLARRAKPFAEKDFAEIKAFARENLNIEDPQSWDLSYAAEKLRQAKYAFSEAEVKKYFPISKVLAGLFAQIKKLYGIELAEKTVPVWHKDVRYFELKQDGQTIGGVYMDLYAREGKRGGAWMDGYKSRRRFADGTLQLPTAYLVCNFTPPVGDKEARLSHDEIITLFHETGHGLHHLLTQVDEVGVSGINGVEWDAVELPSQFMENFVWEYDVLAQMSSHEETGAVLPKELFDKMHAAKNFQRGMFLVRQMEFAIFDMEIYHQEDEGRLKEWPQILDKVRQEVAVTQPPAYNRFALSFSHIFAGGYAAGYYSYAWAEVLSADAYAAFEESDDVAETGRRFWKEVLAVGGSRSAAESFKAFRGREPSLDALLRHSGFDNAA